MQFNIHPQQEKQNMTTPHLKKSMDRSPSRLALLLIPILLACFAIPAMRARDETPNHKEVLLNFIPPNSAAACVGEPVDIRGQLKLKFGFGQFAGQRVFMPVDREVAKGYGQVNCPNSGECHVGFGKSTGRRYTADTRIGIEKVGTHEENGLRINTCRMFLIITGVPNPPPQGDVAPGRQVRFKLFYTVEYGFNQNNKVTFCKPIPSDHPLCRGL